MSELARRTLFAIVAAPLTIGAIYIGDWALAGLLAVTSALAAWELFQMAERTGVRPLASLGIPLAGILPLVVHGWSRGVFTVPLSLVVVTLLVVLGATIWARGVDGRPLSAAAVTVFGVAYTGGTLIFGYLLRYHPYTVGRLAGTALVVFPVLLTWASDTGAYFVGRAFGRRKLIPSVSPGKTVAGALGALVLCVIVSWAYVHLVLRPYAQLALAPWAIVLFGLVVSIAAQIGDLAESLLKREADVKDSSRIIPGHGGVLDRMDAMLFVLPVAHLLLGWLLIPAPR